MHSTDQGCNMHKLYSSSVYTFAYCQWDSNLKISASLMHYGLTVLAYCYSMLVQSSKHAPLGSRPSSWVV